MTADHTDQRIDNYQLLQKLGGGSFGQVYLAEDLRRKTKVAIKVLNPFTTQKERDQFFDEVRSLVRLRHPHIVLVMDFGIDKANNLPFIVMEYAPNGSLRQKHHGQQLPLATVVQYVKQVASALQYAHDDQLIHRDVKPHNIFIGSKGELLLGDFGIAVLSSTGLVSLQQPQGQAGTPVYMAPEQIKGKPSRSSDQYALAIITYEWLSGKPPFTGSMIEIMGQHLNAVPQRITEIASTIPPQVEQVVLKALAKEVKDRFLTIQEFADALEAASKTVPIGTRFFTYRGHGDAPRSFAWSPDGSLFATGGVSGLIQIWDAGTGKLIRTCEGISTHSIYTLVWSPIGTRLASCSDGKTVQVWEALSGQLLLTYSGHSSYINAVAWSPDGFRIASTDWDRKVKVWDANNGRLLLTYFGHSSHGNVTMVAWSPDGSRIASTSVDSYPYDVTTQVQVWDAFNGQCLLTYAGHSDPVSALAWSPDSSRIASASMNHSVQVWNAHNGRLLLTYTGHSDPVSAVAWSPNGSCIASASDRSVTYRSTSYRSIAYRSASDRSVTYYSALEVQIWDAMNSQILRTYTGHSNLVSAVAWSPDGYHIASASFDHRVQVWDALNGRRLLTYTGHSGEVNAVAWSPDGSRIASASGDDYDDYDYDDPEDASGDDYDDPKDNTVQVWDASNGQLLLTYTGHSSMVNAVAWSPDGSRIASASFDHRVQVWDATSGWFLNGHSMRAQNVAWSPDGSRIASGADDDTVQVWDIASGQILLTYRGHSNIVNAVVWSPDGSRIASASADETVQVWQAV